MPEFVYSILEFHIQTQSLSSSHLLSHSLIHTFSITNSLSHTNTHTLFLSHTNTFSIYHTHTLSLSLLTHTYTLSLVPSLSTFFCCSTFVEDSEFLWSQIEKRIFLSLNFSSSFNCLQSIFDNSNNAFLKTCLSSNFLPKKLPILFPSLPQT